MSGAEAGGLRGLTVVSFESRRAAEMAELIRRHGGEPIVAPSMREVSLDENTAALRLLQELERGAVDMIVLLTGVGTRALAAVLAQVRPAARVSALLAPVALVARGPKPVAALKELGLRAAVVVPEPNTWRDLLATLDQKSPVNGLRVAVQEYGVSNPELLDGLRRRGAEVIPVPVYRWALPEDTTPLRQAIERLAGGTADVVLFTSATQIHHVVQVADGLGQRDALGAAAARAVFASIGPICSEALRERGLPVDLEPEHPKMGQLVAVAARRARSLLQAKHRGR